MPYRIGVIGFAHMHIGTMVESFVAMPKEFTWIGCADTQPATPSISKEPGTRGHVMQSVVNKCAMPVVFADYHQLLDAEPDIVFITAENARHAAIARDALSRGIHVIFEKPMATTLADAIDLANIARAHHARIIVNWPTTWFAAFRTAQRLVKEGAAGTPLRFHYRNNESLGPFSYGQHMTPDEMNHEWWYQAAQGGGAYWDYICYGCNLSRFFLGKRPVSAFATSQAFGSGFSDVADYAAMTLRYPDAIAMLEGTWATFSGGGLPSGPIVFGDRGTVVSDRYTNEVYVYNERHQRTPAATYPAEPLPEGRDTLAAETLRHLRDGEPLHETLSLSLNLDAMAALDAGHRSLKSGRVETIDWKGWVE